jgi:hypothetical protein
VIPDRRNLFWGSAGTTISITLAVVACLGKDLRWLLIVAWPAAAIAVWALARSLYSTRGEVKLFTAMGSLLAGAALLYVNSFIKPVTLLPSGEQARLEIRSIVAVPTSRYGSPALNVHFYNAGKFPATNVAHYYNLASANRILAKKEVTEIQDRILASVKPAAPIEEMNPGPQGDSSFTIPEQPGEFRTINLLTMDFNHVLDGSRILYVMVAFSFRDHTMPHDVFGVSESCVCFIRTFDIRQNCGRNGMSLEKMESVR